MGTTVLSHEGREGLWGCDVPTDSSRIPSECRDLGTYFCAVAGLNAQPQWASPPPKRGRLLIKAHCQPQQEVRISQLLWWELCNSHCHLPQSPFSLQDLVSWMGVHRAACAEQKGVRESMWARKICGSALALSPPPRWVSWEAVLAASGPGLSLLLDR